MRRVTIFLLGFLAGVLLLFSATGYHVVRATDGFHLIPRLEQGYADLYCDIRGFTISDWTAHQDLALAILKADRHQIIEAAAFRYLDGRITGFSDRLRR